jgi:hypothetical protein
MSWITKFSSDALPAGEFLIFTNDGMAMPDGMGVINILGDHNIETSASGDTITITDTNTHTVGDLVALTNTQNAYTLQTGRLFITAGNLKLDNNFTNSGGVLTYNGSRFLYSRTSASATDLFLGIFAGNFNTTPGHNIGLGTLPLANITTSQQNVAIGWSAGEAHTNATGANTYVGASVGRLNNGSFNTGIGFACWYDFDASPTAGLRTGNWNVAIGHRAANSYRSNESNNVQIFNVNRGLGDQNTIRIGEMLGLFVGNTSRFFCAGIHDAVVSSPHNVIVNSTDQLFSEPASFDEPETQFLGTINDASNVTGNGATYTLGTDGFLTIFQNTDSNFSGTQYTAPADGYYRCMCFVLLFDSGFTNMDQGIMRMVTSQGTFRGTDIKLDDTALQDQFSSLSIDKTIYLDQADTVSYTIQVLGGSGNTADISTTNGSKLIGITYLGA